MESVSSINFLIKNLQNSMILVRYDTKLNNVKKGILGIMKKYGRQLYFIGLNLVAVQSNDNHYHCLDFMQKISFIIRVSVFFCIME